MRMKWGKAGLAAAIALLAVGSAVANDSSAELAAGGLVLRRTANIEMRSEDLFISPSQVKVTYRFINTSAADISTVVAFPLPDIEVVDQDTAISIPTEDPDNFLQFRTSVDGRPVTMQLEQKAVKNGVDRTAYLRGLGIPLNPLAEATRPRLDALPAATRAALVRMGLAQIEEYDAGRGWERHLAPTWTLKSTYYWTQVFPAGREITVTHQYQPSVGMSAGTSLGSAWFRTDPQFAEYKRRYCLDADFMRTVDQNAARNEGYAQLFESRIEYVLTTGANWAKPIGRFHLVIDKGDPNAIVSFCATGVRKISPTRFEVNYTNFTPRRDISILILGAPPAQ